jgi:hypothetical protein
LRAGAHRLIAPAAEAEFQSFLADNAELRLADGRQHVVRHGHDPVREIQTGIGPVQVGKPKARDRGATAQGRIRFTSNIVPKWARRAKSLDALSPDLCPRGISAGDFREALAALLGQDGPNPSPAAIARLKSEWEGEYRQWQTRDLSARRHLCLGGRRLFASPHGAASRVHAGGIEKFDGGERHAWTEDEIAAFEARWPVGVSERMGFALFICAGQRLSDARKMVWSDFD